MPARRVEIDRVAAAEQSGHHRLGDARGEARGDRRVGGGAAVGEDLGARLGGGRVAGRDGGDHDNALGEPAAEAAEALEREVEPLARCRRRP